MSDNTIRVVARFKAKAGRTEDLKRVLTEFVAPTRAEDGCITYDLVENISDPTDLTFVEEWTSKEALEKHLGSDHIARGRGELPDLLEREGDIRIYRQIA